MGQQRVLSSKFNMSVGFLPAVIAILLSGFASQDISVYAGAAMGIAASLHSYFRKGAYIPQIILYATTTMLTLLAVIGIFTADYCSDLLFPLMIEGCCLLVPFLIFLNRKRFLRRYQCKSSECCKQFYAQGAEAAIVSSRVILLFGFLHFLGLFAAYLLNSPAHSATGFFLLHITPPAVFITGMLFNQFGILYFNRMMQHTIFLPIVNIRGDVTGKIQAADVVNRRRDFIVPVVRIAVASHGMLFLRPRPQCSNYDANKTDLLMEDYLIYGETLEQCVQRILKKNVPESWKKHLCFNLKYHYENHQTNRLVYLFLLDVEDDSALCDSNFRGAKLWTLSQIEQNLGMNYFSECFEYEYEHLKGIIYTREKYKES